MTHGASWHTSMMRSGISSRGVAEDVNGVVWFELQRKKAHLFYMRMDYTDSWRWAIKMKFGLGSSMFFVNSHLDASTARTCFCTCALLLSKEHVNNIINNSFASRQLHFYVQGRNRICEQVATTTSEFKPHFHGRQIWPTLIPLKVSSLALVDGDGSFLRRETWTELHSAHRLNTVKQRGPPGLMLNSISVEVP